VRKFGFKRRVQLRAALEDWDFSNWQAANLPAGLPQEHAASE
jgi:hypothetical protein